MLETADLARAARFYSGLLARGAVIKDGEFELAPGLVIRHGEPPASVTQGSLVDIRVPDLGRAATYLGATVDRNSVEAEVRANDPDGRRIRLRQLRA